MMSTVHSDNLITMTHEFQDKRGMSCMIQTDFLNVCPRYLPDRIILPGMPDVLLSG